MDNCLERFYRLSGLVQYKMQVIVVVALTVLIAVASPSCVPGCATDQASTAELSEAAKSCYALQHSPDNVQAYDKFTVRDLKVVNKTTYGVPGQKWTVWTVRAKLYDANNQYVEDIEEKLFKISYGWSCQ